MLIVRKQQDRFDKIRDVIGDDNKDAYLAKLRVQIKAELEAELAAGERFLRPLDEMIEHRLQYDWCFIPVMWTTWKPTEFTQPEVCTLLDIVRGDIETLEETLSEMKQGKEEANEIFNHEAYLLEVVEIRNTLLDIAKLEAERKRLEHT